MLLLLGVFPKMSKAMSSHNIPCLSWYLPHCLATVGIYVFSYWAEHFESRNCVIHRWVPTTQHNAYSKYLNACGLTALVRVMLVVSTKTKFKTQKCISQCTVQCSCSAGSLKQGDSGTQIPSILWLCHPLGLQSIFQSADGKERMEMIHLLPNHFCLEVTCFSSNHIPLV